MFNKIKEIFINNKKEINSNEDLKTINENIKRDIKPQTVIFSEFEKEQEDNAIISYHELVNNKLNVEFIDDDINDDNELFVETTKNTYTDEEFLIELKELQTLIN